MNIKKYTEKDRYGNMFSYEFDVPSMQEIPNYVDNDPAAMNMQNPLSKANMQGVDNSIFKPKGTDTVPAMLTPGENVVNAEASRLPGVQPMLDELNDMGRAIQKKQGGPIPSYKQEGGFIVDDTMLDAIRQVESGGNPNAVSEVGASGPYQIMKATAQQPGYGVTPISLEDRFDPNKSRAFAKQYLEGIMRANPDFTRDEVITAYHSGAGNVRKAKMGQEELGLRGQEYAGKVNAAMGDVPPVQMASLSNDELTNMFPNAQNYGSRTDSVPEEKGYFDQAIDYIKGIPEAFNKNLQYSEQLQREAVSPGGLDQLKRALGYPLEIFGIGDVPPPDAPGKPTGTLYDKMSPVFEFLNPSSNEVNEKISSQALQRKDDEINKANDELSYMTTLIKDIESKGDKPNASQINKYEAALEKVNRLKTEKKQIKSINEKHQQEVKQEKEKVKTFTLDKNKKNTIDKIIQETNDADYGEGKLTLDDADEAWAKKNLTGKYEGDFSQYLINKGKEIGGVVLDKSIEYFKNAFSSMFDGDELARMAFMYAGSRALGYNHGASLNYGMKNYIKRVDAADKARQKFITDEDNLDKYTKESLQEYKNTGDIRVLKEKKTELTAKGLGDTIYHEIFGPLPTVKTGKDTYAIEYNGQYYEYDHPAMRGLVSKYEPKLHDDIEVGNFFKQRGDSLIKNLNASGEKGSPRIEIDASTQSDIAANKYLEDSRKFAANRDQRAKLRTEMIQAQEEYWKAYAKAVREGKTKPPNSILSFYNARAIVPKTKGAITSSDFTGANVEKISEIDDKITTLSLEAPKGQQASEYRKIWAALKKNWKANGDKYKPSMGKEDAHNTFTYWVQQVLAGDPDALAILNKPL